MNQFRLALRALLKTPGVTSIAILTLSVGIGASVAMFTLMNTLLLRPLAFQEPAKLDRVFRYGHDFKEGLLSPADFLDLQRNEKGLAHFAAYAFSGASLAAPGGAPQFQNSLRVSPGFFDTLKITPQLGRTFLAEEDVAGRNRVIVLTHGLWVDQFNADKGIIGQQVRLDGAPAEVVGVLAESAFERRVFGNARFFRPLALTDAERADRKIAWLNVFGRREANVSSGAMRAFVDSMGKRFAEEHPAENKNTGLRSVNLRESTMKPTGRILVTMLVCLSGLVLLIACSNLANLLLARAMGRAREFAVRAALGASRARLLGPVLAESTLLALAGGAGALLVSIWTGDWLNGRILEAGDGFTLALDWRVLAYALVLSIATILFFGTGPALFAARVSVGEALKSNSQNVTISRGHHRLRSILVISQFAFAMTLVAGAGFFLRGAYKALNEFNGWTSDHVLQGSLHLPKDYKKDAELDIFLQRILENLQNIPGVESASLSYALPYRGLNNQRSYRVDGKDSKAEGARAMVNGITPRYFETTGTRLLAGRAFNQNDGAPQNAAIISESMARALFHNENPIGRRIAVTGDDAPNWDEIVGVVADVEPADVAQQPISFQVYEPLKQDHWYYAEGKLVPVYLAVRSSRLAPESLSASVRNAVAAVDPDLPIRELFSADTMIARFASQMVIIRELLTAFALVGAFLAALGIYGTLSRIVAQRTVEIGIRMALGARAADTIAMILGTGLRMVAFGAIFGFLGSFAVGKFISSALPGLQGNSFATFAAGISVMAIIALIACFFPARRATKINPLVALRAE